MTFLSSIYLWALAAAPLPVLIHLLQRRRARVVEWSSLEFMKPFQQPRTRRVDLRRLLLLALRVLVLVLLALALARPSLPGGAPGADAPSAAVLVLDCSLSMNALDPSGEAILFERAREEALEVLELMREGDRAALVLAGDPEAPPPRLTDDLAALRAELAEARPGDSRTSWVSVLETAADLLRSSSQTNREIYLLSDMQRSGWDGGGEASALGEIAGALAEAGIRIYPVPLGPPPERNLSLEELRVAAGGSGGGEVVVRARVHNQGEERAEGVAVELVSESGHSAATVITVGPGESIWATMETPLPEEEFFSGRVEIPTDDLPADNVRFFALRRPEPHRVLLVGRPSATAPGTRTSHYLHRALDPGPGPGPFVVEEVASGDVTPTLLKGARAVILADCERLGPGALAALEREVSGGSGLMLFVGPGTDLGYMNRTLLPRLFPVQLESPSAEGGGGPLTVQAPLSWGSTENRHPIFRVFAVPPAEALARSRFFQCLKALPGEGTAVLAHFDNGLPALLEGKHGEGRILLFTSSPDLSWGDFPRAGNFVPFVHESLAYLTEPRGTSPIEYLVGEAIRREAPAAAESALPVGATGLGLTLRDPRGPVTPVVPEVVGNRAVLSLSPPPRSGVYRIERQGELVDLFAANHDPRESLPGTLTPLELGEVLRPAVVSGAQPEADLAGVVYAARYGREMAAPLLWLAVLLLLAEILVRGGFAIPERVS